MVLLAGPGPEGSGTRCLSPQSPTPPRSVQTGDDPADYEEYEDFSSLPDTRSIASDDSFYPPGGEEECGAVCTESVPEGVPEAATLLRAACANDVGLLRALVRRGPSSEEVRETDRNGRVSPDRVWVPSALLPRLHFRVTPILDLLPLRAPFLCGVRQYWDPLCGAGGRWSRQASYFISVPLPPRGSPNSP